ncbi:aspartate aminotransferase family protein [Panacibacter ginsenosidivorans]|uniref:Aspartate aminotransferase family protein n=1 Tax=Panacibacter ginsenosidivorans TaxID=1813871 RepID=A0A5B8V8Z9_9BACT|nr:aspartate aminotransferase family protein [Panacibacter ginsenosidivorans]QEC67615.1 aspartate aminotransferase family protein [Panacibacter ginsenosidivorans]
MNQRQLFFQHVAQTSTEPIALEIAKASGMYQYDVNGKEYVDLISGFSVANIGHSNPKVVEAVQKQAAKYMHLIVYGEFIETPQVAYAKALTDNLPSSLNSVYFTNSGAEATEGAMKLAKRATGRWKIIAFNKSYHGSTQGALSLMGDEYFRNAFRPLLPDIHHFNYNSKEVIAAIDENTACIILETIQAESGVTKPLPEWLKAIRVKCNKTGTLLILDEIQAGFGRTGSLWAFEQYNIVPDILLLGKALGGGMPLGAFIADRKIMHTLTFDPVLGHITTFGGHPVSCAAGKAALEVLLQSNLINVVKKKEEILRQHLQHEKIIQLNTAGLWASLEFASFETNKKIIHKCINKGLITDWFLFAPNKMRIAPPLIITEEELINACKKIIEAIDEVFAE